MKTTLSYPNPFISRANKALAWARRVRLVRKLTVVLIIAAIASGIATYGAITQSSNPFGPDPRTVVGLVLTDLILLLALTVIICRRIVKLWLARRRGSVGSRLQTRIVLMFSLVSMVPTVIVAVFSALFFNYGIQSWFDQRVTTALEESVAVAEAYLKEHKNLISADVWSMAAELNRNSRLFSSNPEAYQQLVSKMARERYLADAVVFQSNKILAQTSLSFSLAFERLPMDALKKAAAGNVVVIKEDDEELVRALVKLDGFSNPYRLEKQDTFLLVGRFVDSKVIDHLEKTRGAATEYKRLKLGISDTQIKFSIVFMVVAFLLLLVAAWVGIIFAVTIAKPVTEMVDATQRMKKGDFDVRVVEGPKNDEVGTLARAFNRMAEQLGRQREELMTANHQIDARRHFIETVLAGVSAGVIALDSAKLVTVYNRSALKLLSLEPTSIHHNNLLHVFPEVAEMLNEVEQKPHKAVEAQVTVARGKKTLTLLVRIAAERQAKQVEGYIITFDDISELLSAQRRAAWSDVARRIAHEIKNPLTPIHLAAERLKRKYTNDVSDQETFTKYVETIIRHVGSIGEMVEEFASFARMPAPVFGMHDLKKIVQDAVFSRQCLDHGVQYRLSLPQGENVFYCDDGQITQALTNLLKNAEEALEAEQNGGGACIDVALQREEGHYSIIMQDNGQGFPTQLLDRLTEPYVTTRTKGTGLGLAIVKKIVEDHNGTLRLENNETGAKVILTFII